RFRLPASLNRRGLTLSIGVRRRRPGWRCELQERVDVRPERLPFRALGCGEFGQGALVADAREIGVLLPATHVPGDPRRGPALSRFEEWARGRQVGPEPVEGLAAKLRLCRFVGRRLVPTLPGGSHGRGTGRVYTTRGLTVVAELGIALQDRGPEPSRARIHL